MVIRFPSTIVSFVCKTLFYFAQTWMVRICTLTARKLHILCTEHMFFQEIIWWLLRVWIQTLWGHLSICSKFERLLLLHGQTHWVNAGCYHIFCRAGRDKSEIKIVLHWGRNQCRFHSEEYTARASSAFGMSFFSAEKVELMHRGFAVLFCWTGASASPENLLKLLQDLSTRPTKSLFELFWFIQVTISG